MSTVWKSENVVADHRDLQVSFFFLEFKFHMFRKVIILWNKK